MTGKQMLEGMGFVDDELIEEAEMAKCTEKRGRMTRGWTAAAALIVCAVLSAPALAGAVPVVYDALYAISPATAQFFKPVQLSCEDNGIRMEVTAAYIHDNTAEIYVTMQDMTGNRFDETIDLFDSYDINLPFDSAGTCRMTACDEETQTATFLIMIELMDGQRIEGEKMTFSIGRLLMDKQTWIGKIEDADLTAAEETPETHKTHLVGIGGREIADRYRSVERREGVLVMTPGEALARPTEGVSVTAMGYVDDELRIQVRYEQPNRTDNHGSVYLVKRQTGEIVECYGGLSFLTEGQDRCTEEIFPFIAREDLGEYDLYGSFTTSAGAIEGDWEITFPLEAMDEQKE